jgi:hypothetical protein
MNNMNMPRFTAESAIYKVSNHYQTAENFAGQSGDGRILPQMRVTSSKCGGGFFCWVYLDVFERLCDGHGGGLSTNPDGTISCDF